MIEGKIEIDGVEVTIGPDGWHSEDKEVQRLLETAYPPPASEAGVPWMRAFRDAVKGLKAKVIQEPEAEEGE